MRNLPEDIAARLYDLLAEQAFDELSEAEVTFVLAHISEAEYEHLRRTEAGLRPVLLTGTGTTTPDPALQGHLRDALRRKHARPTVAAWWQRPVPAYQLAVAAVLPVLLFYASTRWQTTPTLPQTPPVQIVYQKIVDTLYLPAREVKAQIAQVEKEVKRQAQIPTARSARRMPPSVPAPVSEESSAPQAESLPMLAMQPFTPSAPSNKGFAGRSLSDDSALTRFIVKVN